MAAPQSRVFGLHASLDNRNGLCVTLDVHQAVGKTETSAAIDALDKLNERGFKPKELGADRDNVVKPSGDLIDCGCGH